MSAGLGLHSFSRQGLSSPNTPRSNASHVCNPREIKVWGYGVQIHLTALDQTLPDEATQAALRSSSSEHIRAKTDVWFEAIERVGVWVMAYKIVGTKEDQTVRSERESLLIAAAKARVWSRAGWQVVVTDSEGKTLDPTGFEKLFDTSAPAKKTA